MPTSSMLILLHAQGPSWLDGVISIPAPIIAALAGLFVIGGLIYFARQLSRRADEDKSEQERRLR